MPTERPQSRISDRIFRLPAVVLQFACHWPLPRVPSRPMPFFTALDYADGPLSITDAVRVHPYFGCALPTRSGARRPAGAPRPVHRVHARQRAARDPASRHQRAGRVGQRLVSRRLGQREAGTHGLRASLRAPDVRGLEERARRRVRRRGSKPPAATTTDRRRPIGPTTTSTSRRTRWSWRCFSNRIAWRYLLDTMTPERVERPARRGQERAAAKLRERAVRHGVSRAVGAALSAEPSVSAGRRSDRWRICRAASHEDVVQFFKTYYAPNNASLVIAGDIDLAETRRLVEKWFSEIPRGPEPPPIAPPAAVLDGVKKQTLTDRVQLPRLYLAWHTPAVLAPGDAAMDIVSSLLTGGKNSRLYQAAGLRPADRAGRERVSAVAGARQRLRDHRDGAPGTDAREDSAGDRRGARQAPRRRRPTNARWRAR